MCFVLGGWILCQGKQLCMKQFTLVLHLEDRTVYFNSYPFIFVLKSSAYYTSTAIIQMHPGILLPWKQTN